MNFSDLYNFLTGWVEVLPSSTAERIINQAREFIYDEYNWSFLSGQVGYIRTPARISNLGTVSVTKYSKNVIIETELQTELDLISSVVENVPVIGRQFRTLSNDAKEGSVVYTIEDYDSGTLTITLSEPYLGETNSGVTYEIFQSYYYPPSIQVNGETVYDIGNIQYVIDLAQNRRLYTEKSLDFVNSLDYARRMRGNPIYFFPYQPDVNGNPIFEIFPAPSQDRILKIIYRRRGLDFTDGDDLLPKNIPSELILTKAKILTYEWIEANKGIYPSELQKVGALSMISVLSNPNNPQGYAAQLEKAIKRDEELYPQAQLRDYARLNYFDDYIAGGNPMWMEPPRETLLINF